jgi:hypothetical protein
MESIKRSRAGGTDMVRSETARPRWEYRLEVMHLGGKDGGAASRADAASMLDTCGRDGWEVVGFSPSHASSRGLSVETTEFVVLLKRPARDA